MNIQQIDDLAALEAIIERGQQTFIEVGMAILTIRDQRLYKDSYSTFEQYCRERWGWSRQHAHQLIDAAEVTEDLSNQFDIPPRNSTQAIQLARLPTPEDRAAAWQEVLDTQGDTATVRSVQEVVSAHVARSEHHLPPETPQTVAIDYARAVRDEPALTGQPVADVVNFQREKRAAQKEAQRQQAQDEQDELNHAFTLLGPESQARMADAAFRVRLGTMLGHVETLIRCDPERVSEIQTESDRRVFGIFAREVRAWLLAVERLINQTGLRVVGERTAGEGEG